MAFDEARQVIVSAVEGRAFPAASVEVGTSEGVVWREAFGRLTYDPHAEATIVDTVFDLASLTKVIATTTIAIRLLERTLIGLDSPIHHWIGEWRGADRAEVTVRDALSHTTGLPAWLPLYKQHSGRASFAEAIGEQPLDYSPRTKSVYSDLGFIILGLTLERAARQTLDAQFEHVRAEMKLGEIRFGIDEKWRDRTAPTEMDEWRGRLLVGEVHDENAAALGGVAAHAGLFGTARAVGTFARSVLSTRRKGDPTVELFTRRQEIPGSSRALGWDTMLPSSSCGNLMSTEAFGHTGYTGTSLWVDPVQDLYVVLLTNRVYPTRENNKMTEVRPAFHNAVVKGAERHRQG